jgi:hypothetical protein
MKISLVSDIHLEFGDWYPVNPEKADVLILSGDIMSASYLTVHDNFFTKRFIQFLVNCKKEYEHVIYIMGNAEHYGGDFTQSYGLLRKVCDMLSIHLLEKETVTIKGVTFIGGTLWTDMYQEDPGVIDVISLLMYDYKGLIRNSNKTFTAKDSVDEHKLFLEFIRKTIAKKPKSKFVVVSHHGPSIQSVRPAYRNNPVVCGAYASNLSEFISSHPQIKVWTHGRTHRKFDYMMGSTRVLCNPRGYIGYERPLESEKPFLPLCVKI